MTFRLIECEPLMRTSFRNPQGILARSRGPVTIVQTARVRAISELELCFEMNVPSRHILRHHLFCGNIKSVLRQSSDNAERSDIISLFRLALFVHAVLPASHYVNQRFS